MSRHRAASLAARQNGQAGEGGEKARAHAEKAQNERRLPTVGEAAAPDAHDHAADLHGCQLALITVPHAAEITQEDGGEGEHCHLRTQSRLMAVVMRQTSQQRRRTASDRAALADIRSGGWRNQRHATRRDAWRAASRP